MINLLVKIERAMIRFKIIGQTLKENLPRSNSIEINIAVQEQRK